MAQTRDLGRFFFYFSGIQPDAPRVHTATTVMVEPPYHRGHSLVIRLPFGQGLVLGFWKRSGWDEEQALLEAVSGWGVDPWDTALDDPEVKQTIRDNVAAQVDDVDLEWQVISALGVDS